MGFTKLRPMAFLLATAAVSSQAWGASISKEESTPLISTTASIDLVSSYVFRGVTLNKNPAIQPGLEAAIGDFTVGTWASLALDAEEGEGEKEVDFYASYGLALTEVLSVSVGVAEYIYPETDVDNDREVSAGIELDTILSPSLSANFGIDGAVEDTAYYELGLSQDVYTSGDFSSSLGTAIAYLDPDVGEAGLAFVQLIASLSYKEFNAAANYLVETDDEVQSLEGAEKTYLSLGTAFSF